MNKKIVPFIIDNRPHNRAVEQEARQIGLGKHQSNLKEIETLTATIRKGMTAKYKTEF